VIDRMGGAKRKDSGGAQAEGSPLAIVLGIVLDGIPESIVLGLTIVVGGERQCRLRRGPWRCRTSRKRFRGDERPGALGLSGGRVLGLWTLVSLVSGLAALVGFAVFDSASPRRSRSCWRSRAARF
jgi:ZIP family zinc transporter